MRFVGLIMFIAFVELAMWGFGQTDPQVDSLRRLLIDDGYSQLLFAKQSGFAGAFAGCDRYYRYKTPFEAELFGQHVSGVICSGSDRSAPQIRRTS